MLKFSRQAFVVYGFISILFITLGLWLYADLLNSRDRTLENETALALEKSRFVSQSVATDVVSLEFVLRDIKGRLHSSDLIYPDPDPLHHQRLKDLLDEKAADLRSMPLEGLALFDRDCVYTAAKAGGLIGVKSNHPICSLDRIEPGQFYVQYLPSAKSWTHKPVLLVVYPFATKDGRLAGGVAAILSVFNAQSMIERFDTRPGGFLALIDENQNILARKPSTFAELGAPFPLLRTHPDFHKSEKPFVSSAVSPDQKAYILGLSPVRDAPLTMVVGIRKDTVLAEWYYHAVQVSASLTFMIVLSFFAANAYLNMWKQRDSMSHLATIDPLTGIANRRRFMQVLERIYKRAQIDGDIFSLLMIDIDHFKAINDTFGHPSGDKVIIALAETLAEHVRPGDLVGRIGGEEFAVILAHSGQDNAEIVADRLLKAVSEITSVTNQMDEPIRFQISVGLAELIPCDADADALLGRADRALYVAKENGRNQVISAPSLQPDMDDGLPASVDNWTI